MVYIGEDELPEPEDDDPWERGGEREKLIGYLRKEAYAVRDCFTKYSVQTTIAVGGALIAIGKFQADVPYVGLLAVFPILLVFHVASMWVHKYGTSNRLLAYELHLHRTSHDIDLDPCHAMMKAVGWEEAMRAWRIIEPNVWATIYWPRDRLRRKLYPIRVWQSVDKIDDPWFDQAVSCTKEGICYDAGGYLRTIFMVFFFTIGACLVLSYIALLQLWIIFSNVEFQEPHIREIIRADPWLFLVVNAIATLFILAVTALSIVRWRNIQSRITILETGLSSIHSGGILWEAIILAHLLALQSLKFFDQPNGQPRSMHGYTHHIAEQTKAIVTNCFTIHAWIDRSRAALDKDIRLYQQR
jgi:hypothetical protein